MYHSDIMVCNIKEFKELCRPMYIWKYRDSSININTKISGSYANKIQYIWRHKPTNCAIFLMMSTRCGNISRSQNRTGWLSIYRCQDWNMSQHLHYSQIGTPKTHIVIFSYADANCDISVSLIYVYMYMKGQPNHHQNIPHKCNHL